MARKRTGDELIDSWIEEEIDNVAQELQEAIKDTVGVDTGALQDAITIEKRGYDRYVGVDQDALVADARNVRDRDYTAYHHNGTSRTRANPFLDIAINKVGNK